MNNLVEKREIFEKRKTVSQMAAEAELEEEIAQKLEGNEKL